MGRVYNDVRWKTIGIPVVNTITWIFFLLTSTLKLNSKYLGFYLTQKTEKKIKQWRNIYQISNNCYTSYLFKMIQDYDLMVWLRWNESFPQKNEWIKPELMKSLTSLTCIYPVILKNETTIVFVFCFCFFFVGGGGYDFHTARVCFLKTNFVVMGKSGRGKNSRSIACPEDPFPGVVPLLYDRLSPLSRPPFFCVCTSFFFLFLFLECQDM